MSSGAEEESGTDEELSTDEALSCPLRHAEHAAMPCCRLAAALPGDDAAAAPAASAEDTYANEESDYEEEWDADALAADTAVNTQARNPLEPRML